MKAALKKKWVAALRSGKYKQGLGQLRVEHDDAEEYCCLGVLADVAGMKWRSFGYEGDREYRLGTSKNSDSLLSDYFAKACDIDPWRDGSKQKTLAEMNDNGKTFSDIADWIERYL